LKKTGNDSGFLTQAVQYLTLERKAPLDGLFPSVMSCASLGLKTLPVKRIREANHKNDIKYPMYVLPIDSAESFWLDVISFPSR
jgi:hypothetical protein